MCIPLDLRKSRSHTFVGLKQSSAKTGQVLLLSFLIMVNGVKSFVLHKESLSESFDAVLKIRIRGRNGTLIKR